MIQHRISVARSGMLASSGLVSPWGYEIHAAFCFEVRVGRSWKVPRRGTIARRFQPTRGAARARSSAVARDGFGSWVPSAAAFIRPAWCATPNPDGSSSVGSTSCESMFIRADRLIRSRGWRFRTSDASAGSASRDCRKQVTRSPAPGRSRHPEAKLRSRLPAPRRARHRAGEDLGRRVSTPPRPSIPRSSWRFPAILSVEAEFEPRAFGHHARVPRRLPDHFD